MARYTIKNTQILRNNSREIIILILAIRKPTIPLHSSKEHSWKLVEEAWSRDRIKFQLPYPTI